MSGWMPLTFKPYEDGLLKEMGIVSGEIHSGDGLRVQVLCLDDVNQAVGMFAFRHGLDLLQYGVPFLKWADENSELVPTMDEVRESVLLAPDDAADLLGWSVQPHSEGGYCFAGPLGFKGSRFICFVSALRQARAMARRDPERMALVIALMKDVARLDELPLYEPPAKARKVHGEVPAVAVQQPDEIPEGELVETGEGAGSEEPAAEPEE